MKNFFLFGIAIMVLGNLSNAQIFMNPNGKVKIGSTSTPTKNLDVCGSAFFDVGSSYGSFAIDNSGYYSSPAIYPTVTYSAHLGFSDKAFNDVWSYNYPTPSDFRLKENIRDIQNPLNIVLKLRGVKYDLKKETVNNDTLVKDSKIKASLETMRKNKIGFIAQEVNEVLPEIVIYDDSTDTYGIDYSKAVPVLVEAIKAQQAQIDSLKQIIKKNFSTLKSAEINTRIDELKGQNETPVLEQNVPNPFSVETNINFYIPQSAKSVAMYIYNLQGTQMKAYFISSRGKSSVAINGSELLPGMYLYTLIVDGKEVNTLKMILTD
jgi:hypothetical protein